MSKQKTLPLFWILSFLFIAFIFGNSLVPGDSSGNLSGSITKYLLTLVNKAGFTIELELFHHYVRKIAHFLEYAALGTLITAAIHQKTLFRSTIFNYMIFWLGVPIIDETIQYFVPERVCAFTDMCIDACGFLFGSLFCYIILCILQDIHIRKQSR